jgi:hypothetical protein
MIDKDVMVLQNHTNSAIQQCGEPSPTSCDANQAISIKVEEVSYAEEEEGPVPIPFPEIKTEALSSDLSDSSDSDNDICFPDTSENSDFEISDNEPPATVNLRKRHCTDASLFQWHNTDFCPIVHHFNNDNSGISTIIDNASTVFDFFKLFFPLHIMQRIADRTNKYYVFLTQKLPPAPQSRLHNWKNTTPEELYIFFGIIKLMARVKKLTITEYWSKDPLIATPQFTDYMSRDRYLLLLRILHFDDNETQVPGQRLHKLQPILDHLRKTNSEVFTPFQNLCIDESLVLFKGRFKFKLYIPSKIHRFGIKVFVLFDCETGYVLDFVVFTGGSTDIIPEREFGISGAVVETLVAKYLQKGHTLWLDSWYSSPLLYNWLHNNGTNVCGTVRKYRKGLPKLDKELDKGQIESRHTDNMMVVKWKDKREFRMLTTLHTDSMKQSGKFDRTTNTPVMKPECVMDYNRYMGAVDKTDMMVSSLQCVRKSFKWYIKLFFHLLDLTLINSHILYNLHTGENITHDDFQLTLIREIFQKFHKPRPTTTSGRPSQGNDSLRLKERHFLTLVPPTPSKENPTRKCHVCSNSKLREKKRRESRYMCAKCGIGLCVHPCFQNYHTLQKY